MTSSDDGTRVVYFIAQNARHAILDSDLQVEQQLNPLWPIRTTTRDEVLAYPEGDPIGRARVGALDAPEAVVAADAAADADEGVAANPVAVAEQPAVEAAVEPATTEDDQPQTTYVVKPGDSAIGIARDLGVDVDQLLAANGVTNRNRIYVGQVLTVPAQSS